MTPGSVSAGRASTERGVKNLVVMAVVRMVVPAFRKQMVVTSVIVHHLSLDKTVNRCPVSSHV